MTKTNSKIHSDIGEFVKVNNDTTVESKTDEGATYNAPLTCIDFSSKNTLRTGLGLSSSVADGSIDLLANCALAVFNTSYTNANFNNTGVYDKDAGNFTTNTTPAD